MPLGHEDRWASGDHEIGEGPWREEVGQRQPTVEETEGCRGWAGEAAGGRKVRQGRESRNQQERKHSGVCRPKVKSELKQVSPRGR